ncbi:MAG: hypothetical protein H0V29_14240 [Thermoleophilaceae bacterium]|nr:hypothetical protein [Thermoleophilaceae bacterium]
MRQLLPLTALVLALALAACGEDSRSPEPLGALEEGIATELRRENRENGAFSQVLRVRCPGAPPGSGGGQVDCEATVRARAFVFRVDYRVDLGEDGCWSATRTALGTLRGSGLDAQELDDPGELEGCIG